MQQWSSRGVEALRNGDLCELARATVVLRHTQHPKVLKDTAAVNGTLIIPDVLLSTSLFRLRVLFPDCETLKQWHERLFSDKKSNFECLRILSVEALLDDILGIIFLHNLLQGEDYEDSFASGLVSLKTAYQDLQLIDPVKKVDAWIAAIDSSNVRVEAVYDYSNRLCLSNLALAETVEDWRFKRLQASGFFDRDSIYNKLDAAGKDDQTKQKAAERLRDLLAAHLQLSILSVIHYSTISCLIIGWNLYFLDLYATSIPDSWFTHPYLESTLSCISAASSPFLKEAFTENALHLWTVWYRRKPSGSYTTLLESMLLVALEIPLETNNGQLMLNAASFLLALLGNVNSPMQGKSEVLLNQLGLLCSQTALRSLVSDIEMQASAAYGLINAGNAVLFRSLLNTIISRLWFPLETVDNVPERRMSTGHDRDQYLNIDRGMVLTQILNYVIHQRMNISGSFDWQEEIIQISRSLLKCSDTNALFAGLFVAVTFRSLSGDAYNELRKELIEEVIRIGTEVEIGSPLAAAVTVVVAEWDDIKGNNELQNRRLLCTLYETATKHSEGLWFPSECHSQGDFELECSRKVSSNFFRLMNKVVVRITNFLEYLPTEDAADICSRLSSMSEGISASWSKLLTRTRTNPNALSDDVWKYLKISFFSCLLVFQSVRSLKDPSGSDAANISVAAITALDMLHFVTIKMGPHRIDAYLDVLDGCVSAIKAQPSGFMDAFYARVWGAEAESRFGNVASRLNFEFELLSRIPRSISAAAWREMIFPKLKSNLFLKDCTQSAHLAIAGMYSSETWPDKTLDDSYERTCILLEFAEQYIPALFQNFPGQINYQELSQGFLAVFAWSISVDTSDLCKQNHPKELGDNACSLSPEMLLGCAACMIEDLECHIGKVASADAVLQKKQSDAAEAAKEKKNTVSVELATLLIKLLACLRTNRHGILEQLQESIERVIMPTVQNAHDSADDDNTALALMSELMDTISDRLSLYIKNDCVQWYLRFANNVDQIANIGAS